MDMFGMIQYENFVFLLGYCCNNDDLFLVYEYFVNGSLDDWLYESEEKVVCFGWLLCLCIVLEIVCGFVFLYYECVYFIIYCDMKFSNILFNENFKVVLIDFGMVCIMDIGFIYVSIIVVGILGYVFLEYF